MKIVRRIHMFTGLFLAPWVLLYGVSAFLFNHPDAFPDREVRRAGVEELRGSPLDGFPTAPELARQAVEALNVAAGSDAFTLVDSEPAAYSRPITATATGAGRVHSLRIEPEVGDVVIRSTASTGSRPSRWPSPPALRLLDPPGERLVEGIPALLDHLKIPFETVAVRNPPDLIFTIRSDDRTWRATYNVQTGALAVRPADDPGGQLSTRRFLTAMHLAFGYPAGANVRWIWAAIVDVMAVAMVFWGASGLLMWWQMKSLRPAGAAALLVSAATAVGIALGMHAVLARAAG